MLSKSPPAFIHTNTHTSCSSHSRTQEIKSLHVFSAAVSLYSLTLPASLRALSCSAMLSSRVSLQPEEARLTSNTQYECSVKSKNMSALQEHAAPTCTKRFTQHHGKYEYNSFFSLSSFFLPSSSSPPPPLPPPPPLSFWCFCWHADYSLALEGGVSFSCVLDEKHYLTNIS